MTFSVTLVSQIGHHKCPPSSSAASAPVKYNTPHHISGYEEGVIPAVQAHHPSMTISVYSAAPKTVFFLLPLLKEIYSRYTVCAVL